MSEPMYNVEFLEKERNMNSIIEQFVEKVRLECPYVTNDQIMEVVNEVTTIMDRFPNSKPETWIELLIKPNINELETIRKSKPVPGYTSGVNVGNIGVQMYGGYLDGKGMHYDVEKGLYLCDSSNPKMEENALHDVASETKFFTQIVAYNLIAEGVFSFDSIISELDNSFSNLGNLTVGDVLSFCASFQTPGRVDDASNKDMALERIYSATANNIGNYNYNDIGMIIMKQVIEKVTGKKYEELVDKYIIKKLNLKDTYLVVPDKEKYRVTGSANSRLGKCNDPKAIVLGGFSGNAGLFMTHEDATKIAYGVNKLLPSDMIADAYTVGKKHNRGKMGNTYISLPNGTKDTFVSSYEPKNTFAYQGSTRTNSGIWVSDDPIFRGANNIFFNPSSMDINWAYVEEQIIKRDEEIKALKAEKPFRDFKLVNHYEANGEKYRLIDARKMLPTDKSVEPVIDNNAKLGLKLAFLRLYLENYCKDYQSERKSDYNGVQYTIGIRPL